MEDKESKMKKLLLIPLLLFCFTAFGQFTKPQLYTNINTNIRLKTYSPTRMASLLDSLVATMGSGSGMVYPGVGIPLSTGSAWGTSITDNSANWNTAFGWGNHASAGYQSALTFSNGLTESAGNVTATGDAPYINFYNTTGADSYNYELSPTTFRNQVINGSLETVITQTKNEFTIEGISGANRYAINVNGANGISFDFPTNATGDTYHRGSSTYYSRLPIGGSGQVYTVGGSSVPIWEDFSTLFSSNFDYSLASDGDVFTISGGIPAWVTPSSGGLDVGTTAITSGTDTRILYNNAGTLGEYTVSGSGNVAMTTSPVFTTPNIGTATGTASGNWFGTGTTTLTGAVDIVGSSSNTIKHSFASLGTTQTDGAGLHFRNTTAASAGSQQQSPSLVWEGNGWKTNATAASQSVKFASYVLPVQGAANPTGTWTLASSINGGAYGTSMTYTSAGLLTAPDLTLSSGILTLSSNRIILFNGGLGTIGGNLNSGLAFRANANSTVVSGGYYRFFNTGGNYTATSGTQLIMGIENNFAPTSGTAIMEGLTLSGTINQTGGANGEVRGVTVRPTYTAATTGIGFYYNPSGTPTNNYAFYATSGKIKLDESPTLNATADRILTYNNSSKLVEYRTTESIAGVSYSSVVEGSYTGGSQVTNVYDGSELTDGQIAYVEVVVTAVQSSGTVGATGYSMKVKGAFRKSGGTLTQIGSSVLDEPLATWNDTGDSFTGTPGLSVSSGAVAFSQNLTTSKTFAYKFSTRVVKK